MSRAPESVVRAAQEALGCVSDESPSGPPVVCLTHTCCTWSDRGCWDAVRAADAAWVAAYPEALRDAAERVDRGIPHHGTNVHSAYASDLRRWADESEAAK